MLQANTTIGELLDGITADMGLFTERDRAFYRGLMNETLTFLYAAVIRMRAEGVGYVAAGILPFISIPTPLGTGTVQQQDVLAVYRGKQQLRYLPPAALGTAAEMPPVYYTVTTRGIELARADVADPLRVVFTLRPPQYGEGDEGTPVPLPQEFVPMLAAKIRGEAYRAAGEDALSAKWLGVYNAYLADFYDYLAERRRALCGI